MGVGVGNGTKGAEEARRTQDGEAGPATGTAGRTGSGAGLGAEGAPAQAARAGAPGCRANNVTIRPEIQRREADPEAWEGRVTARLTPDAAWDGAAWPDEEEGRVLEAMAG